MWLWKGFVLLPKSYESERSMVNARKKGQTRHNNKAVSDAHRCFAGKWTRGRRIIFFSFSDYHVSLCIKKANAIIAILFLCFVFIK